MAENQYMGLFLQTRDRPVLFRRPTRPAPVPDTLFFPCFIHILQVPRRVLEPGQDSGQDNTNYQSLLVVEVQETSENPTQSLTHNIIRRRTQLLAVILYIKLYYIDTYIYYIILYILDIELRESPKGNKHFSSVLQFPLYCRE